MELFDVSGLLRSVRVGWLSLPVPIKSGSGAGYCGVPSGAQRIAGKVTSVHDGDTITVNGESIRLGSIDAPELAQAYGSQSRDHYPAADGVCNGTDHGQGIVAWAVGCTCDGALGFSQWGGCQSSGFVPEWGYSE